jgi:hypothetical protein
MPYETIQLPVGYRPQILGLNYFQSIVELPPVDIVAYFRANPGAVEKVLEQCSDKRYTPSTAITQLGDLYKVGWFETSGWRFVYEFKDLSEAVTDYLLFSFGKGRWRSSKDPWVSPSGEPYPNDPID